MRYGEIWPPNERRETATDGCGKRLGSHRVNENDRGHHHENVHEHRRHRAYDQKLYQLFGMTGA